MADSNPGQRSGRLRARLSGTNVERGSLHNQQVTLQAIRVRGLVSKAELAHITGLTAPAIAAIVRKLLDGGLIREAGRSQGQRGQPALLHEIDPDGAFSIGVAIDRDHLSFVALDFVGQVRARASVEMPFALPEAVLAFVAEQIRLLEGEGTIDLSRLAGIGLAMPDDLDQARFSSRPPGYAAWATVDMRAQLGALQAGDVHIANDATAAAIGELQFGLGVHDPNFFYILVSAGLGGGLVVNGQALPGATGRGGEIGFLPVADRAGHQLQDIVSLSGLYDSLRTAGHRVSRPMDLIDLPPAGQAITETWCKEAGALLAEPLLVINAAVNPAAFYLGGRLPAPLIEQLARHTTASLSRLSSGPLVIAPVVRAALSEDAAAMGAAVLPFSDHFLPRPSVLTKHIG